MNCEVRVSVVVVVLVVVVHATKGARNERCTASTIEMPYQAHTQPTPITPARNQASVNPIKPQ